MGEDDERLDEMRADWIIWTEIEKEKRIKSEKLKLKKIFKNIEIDKKNMIERLVNQAAFMGITLDELQLILNKNGAVEMFENGAQKMLREHPAAKIYNTMIKNYNQTIKTLIDFIPDDGMKNNELVAFLMRGKDRVGK